MAQVKITIRDHLDEKLKAEVERTNLTKAEVVRTIVEEHFAGDSNRSVRLTLEDVQGSIDQLKRGLEERGGGGNLGDLPAAVARVEGQFLVLCAAVEMLGRAFTAANTFTPEQKRDFAELFETLRSAYGLRE